MADGIGTVVHGAENVVANWDITAAEREYLVRTGLPQIPPFLEVTIQDEEDPTVSSVDHGMLYKLAWDLGRNIGIALRGRGVYAVMPDREDEEDWFVNSSLTHFGMFAHRVLRYQMDVVADQSKRDSASIELDVDLLQQELSKIDPVAVDYGWWPLVLEQMGHGLL